MEAGDVSDVACPDKAGDGVLVFTSEDRRLKFLGEVLSNESSRAILRLLIENEMTLTQIAGQTGLSPALVIHHLKKLLQCDAATVTKTGTNKRGRPMKFYRARPVLVISSRNVRDSICKSSSLLSALKKASRFAAIGLAGIATWAIAGSTASDPLQAAFKYPRPTMPQYMASIEPQVSVFPSELVVPIAAAACTVAAGLAIDRAVSGRRQNPSHG